MALHESSLVVPADIAYFELVGQYVGYLAARIGFEASDVARIRQAVDEACANVVMHTETRERQTSFTVRCEENDRQLTIRIQDAGEAFDLTTVAEPDLTGPLEKRKVGGLGIFLMRRLMDQVECRAIEGGKEIVLMKRCVSTGESDRGH